MTVRAGPSREPCSLADVGVASALGVTVADNWQRLISDERPQFTLREDLVPGKAMLFGQVDDPLPQIPPHLSRYACRNNQLALSALEAIRHSVEAAIGRFGAARVGVVLGSSTTGMAEAESAVGEWHREGRLSPSFHLVQLEYAGLSEFVALAAGAGGPCYAISTACSSGAKALIAARGLLDIGVCDAVIAGGVDSLCRLTANGFSALQLTAKGPTNPMSLNRDGLTLGEAAALFLVTRDRGHPQLLGAAETSDAHHMSAPDPAGAGAENCLRGALLDAGLEPASVHYLNLHGTGTRQNDAMESAVVARVLGSDVPCSSTKPMTGHTLGASGALEAAFCWMALTHREADRLHLPPHHFDGERDPALPAISLVEPGAAIRVDGPAVLVSNSFGFGGTNCALVIGDPPT